MTTVTISQVFSFVWSYFRRFRGAVFLAYLAVTVSVAVDLLNPVLTGWIVDTITVSKLPLEERFRQASLLVLLLFGQGVLFHASYRLAHFLNCFTDSKVERLVALEAMDRVQRFSTDWHANTFAGSNVTKVKRAMRAVHVFYDIICYDLYPTVAIVIGFSVLMGFRQVWLGVIFGFFAFFYAGISIFLATKFVAPANRKANLYDNKTAGVLADLFSANATVKAFAREDQEYSYFDAVSKKWMHAIRSSWLRGNIVSLIQNVVSNFLKLIVVSAAVWFWYQGHFSPGDTVFVLSSYGLLSAYLKTIGDRIRDMTQAVNDMENVIAFMHMPKDVSDIAHARALKVKKGEIRFEEVVFGYAGQGKKIYDRFSLVIKPGEKVALVGHSGSGKSTFVKLLQRMYDLQGGKILIDGQDIARVTQQSLRRNIALVPQDPLLFHRTLRENITYGCPKASAKAIEKAARLAHADEFIKNFPHQYETLVGERGIKLSGGERQRVAIARAILADCPILILDEATSSLDSHSEQMIQDALAYLLKGRTAIIIAHRLSTIKAVDRILVFDRGEIVEEGTHAQLLRKSEGIYKRLYHLQAGGFLGD